MTDVSFQEFLKALEAALVQQPITWLELLQSIRRGVLSWKNSSAGIPVPSIQLWYDTQLEEGVWCIDFLKTKKNLEQIFSAQQLYGNAFYQLGTEFIDVVAAKGKITTKQLTTVSLQKVYQDYLQQSEQVEKEWIPFVWGLSSTISRLLARHSSPQEVAPELLGQELVFLVLALEQGNAKEEEQLLSCLTDPAQQAFQHYNKQQMRQQFIQQDFKDYNEVYKALS